MESGILYEGFLSGILSYGRHKIFLTRLLLNLNNRSEQFILLRSI